MVRYLGKKYLFDANRISIDLKAKKTRFHWHKKPNFITGAWIGMWEFISYTFNYFILALLISIINSHIPQLMMRFWLIVITSFFVIECWWIKLGHPRWWAKREDLLIRYKPYLNIIGWLMAKSALKRNRTNITKLCNKRRIGIEIPFQNTHMVCEAEGDHKKYLKNITWTKTDAKPLIWKDGDVIMIQKDKGFRFRVFFEFMRIPKEGKLVISHD